MRNLKARIFRYISITLMSNLGEVRVRYTNNIPASQQPTTNGIAYRFGKYEITFDRLFLMYMGRVRNLLLPSDR